ncbi:MAG: hypothetical protein ABIQ40_15485 [Bacteroidia bacterium]
MTDKKPDLTFKELVRRRPAMYLGNDGVIGLIRGLILDCINICKTDCILFSFSILEENKYSLELSSEKSLSSYLHCFKEQPDEPRRFHPSILVAISKDLEIVTNNDSKTGKDEIQIILNFGLDKTIPINTTIDFLKLLESGLIIGLLNRQSEILIKDFRHKFLQQNYFHFPQGIFYLFEQAKEKALRKPEFEVTYDGKINENNFQIALCYRGDWYPSPSIMSFADNIHTIGGGSLVDGIIEGLIVACEKYVADNNLSTYELTDKKISNGLILVCSVSGGDYNFGGSFKEFLTDENIKTQAKEITCKAVEEFIMNNKEKAETFLWRFDKARIGFP